MPDVIVTEQFLEACGTDKQLAKATMMNVDVNPGIHWRLQRLANKMADKIAM